MRDTKPSLRGLGKISQTDHLKLNMKDEGVSLAKMEGGWCAREKEEAYAKAGDETPALTGHETQERE